MGTRRASGNGRPGTIVWLMAAIGLAPPVAAGELVDALKGGKAKVDLRARYERVDDETFEPNANATTIRLRLGYGTGSYHDFSAFGEFEAIRALQDCFDSTANGKTSLPQVPDPEAEEVNQLYLAYRAPGKTDLRLGRQRILRGNQRFVGNVGWRQNEQTYDAFSAAGRPTDRLAFFYARVENVNRIFGEDHPVRTRADTDMTTDLAEVSYRLGPGTITGYAHLLEFEDEPARSHRNLGVRFDGSRELAKKTKLLYAAEYADQADYEDAPSTVDADYRLLEVGVEHRRVTYLAGYELLAGDGVYAFQTPLATGHKFNGWADRFLITPTDGLQDLYLSVSTTHKGYRFQVVYHDFEADEGGSSYGSEWNFVASRKFFERYTAAVHYADYDADPAPPAMGALPHQADAKKLWLTLQLQI